jgi:hypothetical protein
MASNGSVLSVLTDVLKNLYLGTVNEQINNEVLVTQILQLDSKHVDLEGLQAVIALHTGRSSGIGSRDELDNLPATGNQVYKKAVYDLKYHYATIQVSGQALQKTKSNVGAFLRAYESELAGIKNDVAMDFARQIYGDGTGFIGVANGAGTAASVVTLTSAEPIVKGFLYPGMVIDIGTTAAPQASASAVTILDVNEATPSITLTANATWLNSDKISRAGNNKASATKEMDAGLQSLVSTAANTIGGIDSSTNSVWANLADTSGGAIALTNLMQDFNKVSNKGVKANQLLTLTTPGLARRLFETADFKSNVRFVNTTNIGAGFEQLEFSAGAGKLTLTTDRLAPWGKVFMVPTENFRMFTPGDWDFLAKDGQAVKWVQNKDAFQSILYRYANMGTNRRNNSLVYSGLTDTGF